MKWLLNVDPISESIKCWINPWVNGNVKSPAFNFINHYQVWIRLSQWLSSAHFWRSASRAREGKLMTLDILFYWMFGVTFIQIFSKNFKIEANVQATTGHLRQVWAVGVKGTASHGAANVCDSCTLQMREAICSRWIIKV